MNGICLMNQVRSRMLRYTSQIAEEASFFFSVTLFRTWFYDNQFSQIKFNLRKILEVSQEHTRAMLVKLQSFISQFNRFDRECYYHTASLGRLLLNLCIMSHRGNHLSVLYDKIPVFYALKYPKFTTITFYPSAWRPNPLLTLPNCTISLLDRMRILTIFSLTWQYQAQTWR